MANLAVPARWLDILSPIMMSSDIIVVPHGAAFGEASMPLWKIYHPIGVFTAEDKQAIAEKITSIYRALPKFYVGVVFQDVLPDSFFVGGERADDFVRIWVDHIARTFNDEGLKIRFLEACGKLLAPFIAERGLRWEMHVDETPFSLWTIQGLRPPPPDCVAERRWKADNKATAYSAEETMIQGST
jgi:phenylpyruvate tautomerase PptA (4-oxalocrotonate tautomerase family)